MSGTWNSREAEAYYDRTQDVAGTLRRGLPYAEYLLVAVRDGGMPNPDDVLQDVWMGLLQKGRILLKHNRLRGYLLKAVTNRAHNIRRGERRRNRREKEWSDTYGPEES
jgi:DNA-directed RNA polymerase specialized sigma24 family protein